MEIVFRFSLHALSNLYGDATSCFSLIMYSDLWTPEADRSFAVSGSRPRPNLLDSGSRLSTESPPSRFFFKFVRGSSLDRLMTRARSTAYARVNLQLFLRGPGSAGAAHYPSKTDGSVFSRFCNCLPRILIGVARFPDKRPRRSAPKQNHRLRELRQLRLPRDITSHSMKNLSFHSLLDERWLYLPILTTSLIRFSLKMCFLNLGVKGLINPLRGALFTPEGHWNRWRWSN